MLVDDAQNLTHHILRLRVVQSVDQVGNEGLQVAQSTSEIRSVGDAPDGIVEDGDRSLEQVRGVGLHDDADDLLAIALEAVGATREH